MFSPQRAKLKTNHKNTSQVNSINLVQNHNRSHINRDFKFPDDFDRKLETGGAPGLLLVHLDDVVLLHLQSLRSLVIIDPAPIK